MRRRKFSDVDLGAQIREGKTVGEIAQHFGVSERTVYKRTKLLRTQASKELVMHQAGEVLKLDVSAWEQMVRSNERTLEFLDRLIAVVESPAAELQQKIAELQPLLGGDRVTVLEALLKAKHDHRQEIRLLMDLQKMRFEMEEIHSFIDAVITIVGDESPAAQQRIVERLKQECCVRLGLEWNLRLT